MRPLLIALTFGAAVMLIYDALARPEGKVSAADALKRLGPRGLAAAAGGLTAFLLTGWVVAGAGGAAAGASVPALLTRRRDQKMRIAKSEAIAEVAGRLRDSIRAGVGVQDALEKVAVNPPPAIAADLRALAQEIYSYDAENAAAQMARRFRDPSMRMLATSLIVATRLGSRATSDVLASLARATSSKAAVVREAQARQTRNRVSARIVAAVPLLLLIAIRRTNPEYLEPFGTATGQGVLAVAFALVAAGFFMMSRLGRLEETPA